MKLYMIIIIDLDNLFQFMLSFYVKYHYIAIMANTIYTTLHRYLLHIGSHKAKIFSYGWQSWRPSFNMASGSDTIHNIALCITYIILQTLRHTLNKLFRIGISYFVMIYALRACVRINYKRIIYQQAPALDGSKMHTKGGGAVSANDKLM